MPLKTCGNNIYRWLAVIIMLMMIAGMASAQEKQISEIKITGNERVSTDAIVAAITMKPGMPFTEQAVQDAKLAIENMGYFQPGVTAGVENLESGVRVVFSVAENPVVKEIKITGNTVVETEKLLGLMRTSVGSVLNTNTFLQQDTKAIENYFDDLGYIAYVTEEVGIDPQTGVLNVPIMEVRIEKIQITGLKKTKEYVVLREMQQKPGDVYNRKILLGDLQRIYDLNIFDREVAEGYKTDAGSDFGKMMITIPLKESKTGEATVGLGYSNKKIVGQARLSQSNFRGRAETVNLSWEQGTNRGSSFEVGFFEPWLDSKHTSFGINIYNKLNYRFSNKLLGSSSNTTDDYDERRQGGNITLSRPFSISSRGFFTVRNESVDTNITDDSPLSSNGNVASGTFRFTNTTRDSVVDPVRGVYNSYAVELGNAKIQELNGDSNSAAFAKYSFDVRRYFSKGGPRKEVNERRKVLAFRLMAGSLTGSVPFFEQYFLGGAESLRGYSEDRFWGPSMLLASAEYRLPMSSSLIGVVFADYGDAWGAKTAFREKSTGEDLIPNFTQHEGFKGNLGYGIGIRVQTPIGPLCLDYGFSNEGSRAHFRIGQVF